MGLRPGVLATLSDSLSLLPPLGLWLCLHLVSICFYVSCLCVCVSLSARLSRSLGSLSLYLILRLPCLPPPSLPVRPPSLQLHGHSREQRYTKLADWRYIAQCVTAASPMPLFGGSPALQLRPSHPSCHQRPHSRAHPQPETHPPPTPVPPGDPGLANRPQELALLPTCSSLRPQPLPLRKRGHLVLRGRQPRHADWSCWGHDCPVGEPGRGAGMWEFCPGGWCPGLVVCPQGRLCRDRDREMPGVAAAGEKGWECLQLFWVQGRSPRAGQLRERSREVWAAVRGRGH